MNEVIKIKSDDFWVKIVEFLQQNWALIEPMPDGKVCVYFVSDTSGVFDEIAFPTEMEAINALRRNGFEHYTDDENLQSFLHSPSAPFHRYPHPNGPIYSSGQYWKS